MVTIEILEKSQPTRPRHWIPIVALIFMILTLLIGGLYCALTFGKTQISQSIINLLPQKDIKMGETVYTFKEAMQLWFVPLGLLVMNIANLVFVTRICSFRKVYWWLGVPLVIGFIVELLLYVFLILIALLPMIANLTKNIPETVMIWINRGERYGVAMAATAFAAFEFLCLFYNINYPAKYEEIYRLRKERLKSFVKAEDRAKYKKRFYRDYLLGRWISMMLDLHFRSLEKGSREPMRRDAYDFMVYFTCLCDGDVQKAILDEYAREGRYFEARALFHSVKDKAESVQHGARVILPTYEPAPRRTRHFVRAPKMPDPLPPLEPQDRRHPKDKKYKRWNPEEIA